MEREEKAMKEIEDKEMTRQELETLSDMEAKTMMKLEEEQEEEMALEDLDKAYKEESIKEALKELAQRVKKHSTIDWDAENRDRPSDAPEKFGCEICNDEVGQPDPFADKENSGLCDNCRELVVRLAERQV